MRRAWWDSSINPWLSGFLAIAWFALSVYWFADGSLLFGIAWAVFAVGWGLLSAAAFMRRRRAAQRAGADVDGDVDR